MEFGDILNTNFVKEIQSEAHNKIIKMEQKSIRPTVVKLALEYAAEHKLLISNIDKLLLWYKKANNPSVELDQPTLFTPIQLYCIMPHQHSIELFNFLKSQLESPTKLVTKLINNEYRIQCDFFEAVQINRLIGKPSADTENIPQYIDPIIMPYSQPNRPTMQLYYFPPEIEIIEVYHKLYLPNMCSEWKTVLPVESELYNAVISRTEKIGGKIKHRNRTNCNIPINITTLRSLIFEKFVTRDYIVVGSWATIELTDQPQLSKLQIISKNKIEDDIAALSQFLKLYTEYGITWNEHNMHIPQDFRVHRITVHVQYPTCDGGIKEKPLLDIFNSAQFELIPYINMSNNSIGNYWVLLRFLMIDLLVIRLIWRLGRIDEKVKNRHLNDIFTVMGNIRNNEILTNTVFGADYYGVHIDQIVARNLEQLAFKTAKKRNKSGGQDEDYEYDLLEDIDSKND